MFSFFKDIFSAMTEMKTIELNPANGLPMIEDTQIDVGGNFFGFSNDNHNFQSDSFNSNSFSSFDRIKTVLINAQTWAFILTLNWTKKLDKLDNHH